MPTAWLAIRPAEGRIETFTAGLKRSGFAVKQAMTMNPADGDVLIIWNRYGQADQCANAFEKLGLRVLVAENATWGNDASGGPWLSLWLGTHNRCDSIAVGDTARWDALGIDLAPWRPDGGETVGLPQRGIGPAGIAMPRGWIPPGCDRIRAHPGTNDCMPLETDLARASKVVTWGSGAAVKALQLGINVESHMPGWAGEQNNTDAGRLAMFQRLAWAQWTLREISDGVPFAHILEDVTAR